MDITFYEDKHPVAEGTFWIADMTDEPRLEKIVEWFKKDWAYGNALIGNTSMFPIKEMEICIIGPIQYCGPHGMIESSITSGGEIAEKLSAELLKIPVRDFSAHLMSKKIVFFIIMGYEKLWR